MWLSLAWKNLWRNKNRTAITISAIFFAVIISVSASSLQDGVFANFIKNMVGYYTGYIQIHLDGYWNHQVLDNSLERNANYEASVAALENVSAIAPRIESYALASVEDVSKGCMVVGVSPTEEDKITALSEKVIAGAYFSTLDSNSVLMAEGLSHALNLALGDTVYLISQGYHGSIAAGKYPIRGILHFGSPELNDQLLFMPLQTAQGFYSAPNLLTSYVLGIHSDAQLESTVQRIKQLSDHTYEVMSWKELLPDVAEHIQMDKASMYIIVGILYLLICFGILGTLIMMMIERKYEMSMLVAIGMKKSRLAYLFIIESVLTVLIGAAAGLAFSIPVVYYLKEYPLRFGGEMAEAFKRWNFEPTFPASMDPHIFITQGLIVIFLGLLLSIYPVITVFRLDPVKSMKR